MTGDGTNDAPALAQADVAVAMNSGTQAAKEAGNMVDLDSNPTKLIEIVEIGKQLLITRGSLTTFSLANDVAKYFAIIPAAFATTYPVLDRLNIMRLATPEQRDPVGRDFQCLDHHRADSAGVARRPVSCRRRRPIAARQPADLRRRRADRAVHRHQNDRLAAWWPFAWPKVSQKRSYVKTIAIRRHDLSCAHDRHRHCLSDAGHAIAQIVFPHQANGSLIVSDGKLVGSELIGQTFDDPNTSGAGPRPPPRSPTMPRLRAAAILGRPIPRCSMPSRAASKPSVKRIPTHPARCRSIWSRRPPAASIRTSAPRPRNIRFASRQSPRLERESARIGRPATPTAEHSACWASRVSTF